MSTAIPFEAFYGLTLDECDKRIRHAKQVLGENLFILGHHYQRDEVYQYADATGDSLALSLKAASARAKYIVFCGVHFMAEVSDIMTREDQVTLLPDLAAGCSMADMANLTNVRKAWKILGETLDVENEITPITYVNSTADLKAFCGEHGGITCTSTNAQAVLTWALQRRPRILFFPDQHLGRNTAYKMGIPLSDMVEWDFNQPQGGLTSEQIHAAKIFLWKGYCSVHNKFKPEDIDRYLAKYPEAKIIAHPESCFEVCQRADYVGSTSFIINTIQESPANTHWLVATELNLVNRLHQRYQHQGKIVRFMAPTVSMCSTMFRTDPQHLAWVLENLVQGHIVNPIKVPQNTAELAKIALNNMFALAQ
ncbi:MAG: quinolinate synthase NadA [Legionellales bacterium]|nr:quinolinate synthase NadA [Legionellales bacterium]